jgi:transmembrane sensor
MNEMKNKAKYTDREWRELSSILSGEKDEKGDLLGRFMADDSYNTAKYWKELRKMKNEKEINVDKAWSKLYSRLDDNGFIPKTGPVRSQLHISNFLRIAAAAIILLGIGAGITYMGQRGIFTGKTVIATSANQKNLQVTLPDGSIIFLNRNTVLSYRHNFGKNGRKVTLNGEAFFDITPDSLNPFIVNTGIARIKVVGTSFNVISDNSESAVEVYVETGKVMVSDKGSDKSIVIEPGFVGTVNKKIASKKVNDNPNYMSWNTNLLIYNGQTLNVVFRDLKKVYDMNIVADNPEILNYPWSAPIINQPQEKIIRLICASFDLGYSKEGDVYHLHRK